MVSVCRSILLAEKFQAREEKRRQTIQYLHTEETKTTVKT